MNLLRIATRLVEARRKQTKVRPKAVSKSKKPILIKQDPETLHPQTEYACKVELSLTADFEGDIAKKDLIKKIKSELIASIKAGMTTVCKDFNLECSSVLVQPLQVEVAVNDQADLEDDEDSVPEEFLPPSKPSKKSRKR